MSDYCRNYEGEYFFFTLVTCQRMHIFGQEHNRKKLSAAIKTTQSRYPWEMTAIVLLPDHLHMIWKLPDLDRDYSHRISVLKRYFTRAYLLDGGRENTLPPSQQQQRNRGVWQRRFWEHTIRDARDFRMHLDYIHTNPVKHQLADKPRDWKWSSFHRYIEMGWYEPDWNLLMLSHI